MKLHVNPIVLAFVFGWLPFTLQAQSDPSEPKTRSVEWQKPGMPLKKGLDLYALRDDDGLVIVWNKSKPYFRTKVVGAETKGTVDGHSAYFLIDGIFLQVLSLETEQFLKSTDGLSDEQILVAHRDWEFDYMKNTLHSAASVKSWLNKLPDGTPILYWEAIPEKMVVGKPMKHIMVTRRVPGAVICATSVEDSSTPLDKAKALIFYTISHVELLSNRLEATDLQKVLTRSKP
jgi:hypothetical protein